MPLPPVAARVLEYEEPTSPPGRDDVVTESAELMTIDRLAELAVSLLESVTLNTSPEDVPAVVGVPEMAPAELRLRPAAGSHWSGSRCLSRCRLWRRGSSSRRYRRHRRAGTTS